MKKLTAGACALLLAAALLIGYLLLHGWLFLRLPGGSERAWIVVDIPPRMGAMSVAQLLQEKHLVSDAQKFYLLCRYRKASRRLRAGEYGFAAPATPDQILEKLVQGKVLLHRLTIPEGSTLWDVAKIVEEQGLASAQDIVRLAQDPQLMQSLGISGPSLEGYLFPETYQLPKTQDPQAILRAMVQQFRQQFPESWVKRSGELGLRVQDVVTLASIVEKEAVVDGERARIASVFYNRLKKNMPLQSDPTSVYDLPGFSGPVSSGHLKRQSPYNTYLIKGLPIGPICNPGRKSLEAALYPEASNFLYFVSNMDGTHQFSATIAEHQQAVGHYREKVRAVHEQAKPGQDAPVPPTGSGGGEVTPDERPE